ncbi:hypothetical protein BKA67DRAFT_168320 [Truncatella angustata]|uniref:Uncharacterized protein n=1 Tax=Truncatella angustata TaxID=152316 RepID=A0A9P8UR39_9PEZI|nr:uncharacterized protein BKA67DRAFT_168320 [Truncatella angustata]KAH6656771.1 hypothetical protein BKA67DRAFT_168320 [Truncatella angustata]
MSESSSADLEPQTLPRYYPKERHNQRDTTPTFSSPSASPSLSFPSPSRSFPFSPLRRSPSPPNTNSLHSPQADAGNRDRPHVVRDHKDALTQRLNDLAARLAADEVMQGEDVDSMHTKVDELEALMFMMRSKPLNYDRARSLTSDNYEGPGSGSGRLRSSSLEPHFSKVSLPKSEQTVPQHHGIGQGSCLGHPEHVEGTNKHQVTRVLAEAQKLQAALESIVNNLKARQEEQEVRSRTLHTTLLLISKSTSMIFSSRGQSELLSGLYISRGVLGTCESTHFLLLVKMELMNISK